MLVEKNLKANCGVDLCEGRLNILAEIRVFWLSHFRNNVRGEKCLFMVCKYLYNIEKQMG